MPSQAVVNPEELERFARNLKQFNTQLRDGMARLQGEFGQLGATWRDEVHEEFATEFQYTIDLTDQLVTQTRQQAELLLAKADALRRFLDLGDILDANSVGNPLPGDTGQ